MWTTNDSCGSMVQTFVVNQGHGYPLWKKNWPGISVTVSNHALKSWTRRWWTKLSAKAPGISLCAGPSSRVKIWNALCPKHFPLIYKFRDVMNWVVNIINKCFFDGVQQKQKLWLPPIIIRALFCWMCIVPVSQPLPIAIAMSGNQSIVCGHPEEWWCPYEWILGIPTSLWFQSGWFTSSMGRALECSDKEHT